MKVYCKNCKYDIEENRKWVADTLAKWGRKYKICYSGLEKTNIGAAYNLFLVGNNSYGDCKNYKRKWWKFWITQGSIR